MNSNNSDESKSLSHVPLDDLHRLLQRLLANKQNAILTAGNYAQYLHIRTTVTGDTVYWP
jgi:hypothetical protein